MNGYLTLTFDPTDNKLKRFIRRLRIWWMERKKPISVGAVWNNIHSKDMHIIIYGIGDDHILYYHVDAYAILGNFFFCTLKKIDLLRNWERTKWVE